MSKQTRVIALISSIFMICASLPTLAAKPGPYVGGQLGFSSADSKPTHHKKTLGSISDASSHGGLAGRVDAGWNFNPYFGVEAGYTRFGLSKSYVNKTQAYKRQAYALDVVGKASLPVNDHVDLYGKAGVAYVTSKITSKTGYAKTGKHSAFRPTVGAGIAWYINKRLDFDATFTRVIGKGKHSNIPSQNYVGAGITIYLK